MNQTSVITTGPINSSSVGPFIFGAPVSINTTVGMPLNGTVITTPTPGFGDSVIFTSPNINPPYSTWEDLGFPPEPTPEEFGGFPFIPSPEPEPEAATEPEPEFEPCYPKRKIRVKK